MKQEMRRKDRALTCEEAEAILKKGKYGILSTVCADGYPYGLPISYGYKDGKLYFHHTCEGGQLSENIGDGVKACFTVVGDTELLPAQFATRYESAVAFGTVRETEDKIGALMRIVEDLSPNYMEQGRKYAEASLNRVTVYEFMIEQLTGKARRT